MVCGAGEAKRWLKESLDEFKRLCDDAVICLCNATNEEKEIIRQYGFQYYEDNREWGKYQPTIKTDLLNRIAQLGADWVLALDADETLPSIKDRADLESLTTGRISCYMWLVNLWNDEQHWIKTGGLAFWNVRFYKLPSEGDRQFLRKNVHCGSAPPVALMQNAANSYVPHVILHKGLMKEEDRLKKVQRYEKYDPNAVHKGREYYDQLKSKEKGEEYHLPLILNQISQYCKTLLPSKKPTMIPQKPRKFVYVRRNDSKHRQTVVEIPIESWEMTKRVHPTWEIIDDTTDEDTRVNVEGAPKKNDLECDACGFISASAFGLNSHKRIRHKST